MLSLGEHLNHLVADLEGLRTALDVDRIVPLGQSFGGRLAAAYAVAHADRTDRLVLHAPPITNPLRPNAWSLRPALIDPVLIGVDACRDLADLLPHGTLHLFTHFPEHEQPDDHATAVRDLLDR